MTSTTTDTTQIREQIVEFVRQGQDAVLQAVQTWSQAVPSLPGLPDLPVPSALPAPKEIVDGAYDLAEQLLAAQRHFAIGLIDAVAPALRQAEAGRSTKASATKN